MNFLHDKLLAKYSLNTHSTYQRIDNDDDEIMIFNL